MIGIRLQFNCVFEKIVAVSVELCIVVQAMVALYLYCVAQWLNSNLGRHKKKI